MAWCITVYMVGSVADICREGGADIAPPWQEVDFNWQFGRNDQCRVDDATGFAGPGTLHGGAWRGTDDEGCLGRCDQRRLRGRHDVKHQAPLAPNTGLLQSETKHRL